jgi:lipoic acid synthetase
MSERTRKPGWLRVKALDPKTRKLMSKTLVGLHTVCEEANCPNIGECFTLGTATFMILGDRCTRNCAFCMVEHGEPEALDPDEPTRLADAAAKLNLKHVVITSVTRDDLPDGGAAHFAYCTEELRRLEPAPSVELLTPDFMGDPDALDAVFAAPPDVFNHNVETVPRLYPNVRPEADYGRSIGVLAQACRYAQSEDNRKMFVKSGLMVGLGETFDEVVVVLGDLREAGVDLVTIGQYLKPRSAGGHCDIARYVEPGEFKAYAEIARDMGFSGVASGPLVRSSYRAGEQFGKAGS